MSARSGRLERVRVPAMQGLRSYWGTALLVVAACAAGLAVMLPVTALVAPRGGGLAPVIAPGPVPSADIGVVWGAFAQSPAEIRRAAVAALVRLLLSVSVGVLAVTWFTTLSLSTARADARASEIGARRAVGASRRLLFAAALLEGGCLAVLALVVGGAAGLVAARLALGAWPGTVAPGRNVLGLADVAATLGGIVLGALFPLIFARRSSQIAVPESSPVGLAIPAAQLGLSLAVLVTASLLVRGSERISTSLGAGPAAGELFRFGPHVPAPAVRAAEYASLLHRLKVDPAVEAASLTSPGAETGMGPVDVVWSDFSDCAAGFRMTPIKACRAAHYVVSADTFRTLGLRVVAGRPLSDADGWGARRVAVISRSLAPLWPPARVVGRTLQIGHQLGTDAYTVVGVVDDRQPAGFGGGLEPREAVYLSVLQHPPTVADLLVRGRLAPEVLAGVSRAIRAALGLKGGDIARVSEAGLLAREGAPLRWFAAMFGTEGWALLALATLGTFAMMWLWVSSLLGELGVRRAVGARRVHVLGHVLPRALVVAAGGVAIGWWAGLMLWDFLTGLIAGLPAWDPGAVIRYGLLLGVAALAGAFLPAWRAARAHPVDLLQV